MSQRTTNFSGQSNENVGMKVAPPPPGPSFRQAAAVTLPLSVFCFEAHWHKKKDIKRKPTQNLTVAMVSFLYRIVIFYKSLKQVVIRPSGNYV
jgi:hypothetical protein